MTEEIMKYYEVSVKCGHVGKNWYVIKTLAVRAESGKMAAYLARKCPRVKHDHKDAILSVQEVTQEKFFETMKANKEDPFFLCKNIQEQRKRCLDIAVIHEEGERNYQGKKTSSAKSSFAKGEKLKNPKRYLGRYCVDETRMVAY